MLGPEQWRWLEDLLTKEHADVNLIGTGLQVRYTHAGPPPLLSHAIIILDICSF